MLKVTHFGSSKAILKSGSLPISKPLRLPLTLKNRKSEDVLSLLPGDAAVTVTML